MGMTVRANAAHQKWLYAAVFKMLADECEQTGIVLDASTLRLMADRFAASAKSA